MQIYLVGGAVRDTLLGLPVTERDYVVVGSEAQTLLDLGYQPVGRDFPYFCIRKRKKSMHWPELNANKAKATPVLPVMPHRTSRWSRICCAVI